MLPSHNALLKLTFWLNIKYTYLPKHWEHFLLHFIIITVVAVLKYLVLRNERMLRFIGLIYNLWWQHCPYKISSLSWRIFWKAVWNTDALRRTRGRAASLTFDLYHRKHLNMQDWDALKCFKCLKGISEVDLFYKI